MKVFILTCFSILFSMAVFAQSTDSVAIYDVVKPPTHDQMMKPDVFQNIGFKRGPAQFAPGIQYRYNPLGKESTIVVINNRIYSTHSKEFQQLQGSRIIDMKVVKDDSSSTGINNIIIVNTK